MKKINRILAIIFAYTLPLGAMSQAVSPEEFQKGISVAGIQVLDVRTYSEYKNAHIVKSMQADWTKPDQFKDRIQYVDKSKPVYVYCASGGRSNAAAKWMRENGYSDVKELKGGITAWNAEKKPTEGVAEESQLTSEAYAKLFENTQTVLVDFGAPWCPPCIKMAPIISSLQKDPANKFKLIKLDPTVQVAIASEMKIVTIPTFVVYKKGKEVYRKEGPVSREELKAALGR